ncbi:MAG TPA: hypothetical protein PLQ60_07540 [Paludibacteraceae bacterium]|nr:hypothetical protein [Paludibacteraceae bacterium]
MAIPTGFFCSLPFLPKGCPYVTKSISQYHTKGSCGSVRRYFSGG